MIFPLLQFFASKFLLLALHLEAGSFPRPLTAKEEIETFAALRAGDSTAREKLIRHNLRLVAHITKKYYAQPCDQDDLISIGTIRWRRVRLPDRYCSGRGADSDHLGWLNQSLQVKHRFSLWGFFESACRKRRSMIA